MAASVANDATYRCSWRSWLRATRKSTALLDGSPSNMSGNLVAMAGAIASPIICMWA
jgi:hypothetical protein